MVVGETVGKAEAAGAVETAGSRGRGEAPKPGTLCIISTMFVVAWQISVTFITTDDGINLQL